MKNDRVVEESFKSLTLGKANEKIGDVEIMNRKRSTLTDLQKAELFESYEEMQTKIERLYRQGDTFDTYELEAYCQFLDNRMTIFYDTYANELVVGSKELEELHSSYRLLTDCTECAQEIMYLSFDKVIEEIERVVQGEKQSELL